MICHASDPSLRLCLDFEGSLVPDAIDLSGGNHDALATAIQPMPRAGQQAAALTTQSSILVPETPDLDITAALSIEMWISPAQKPSSTAYPLTNAGQYQVSYDKNGRIGCAIGESNIVSPSVLQLGAFVHIACTFDGALLKVYLDGGVAACLQVDGPIPTRNMFGTEIGANKLVGGLDDIHVYARALTDADICTLAGHASCNTICPSGGG
ncbi:MAG: hypothetical protein JWO36_4223 [Myxococcales bacterium]|nr:hypothetical protein [Myxococcales bacterium]